MMVAVFFVVEIIMCIVTVESTISDQIRRSHVHNCH